MALLKSVLILAVTAFFKQTAGSALRDEKFCENLGIIGGRAVTIEEVPFMAALLEKDWFGKDSVVCGGSIINSNFVLTAASCIRFELSQRRVLVGSDSLNSTTRGLIIDVTKTICHEKYNDITKDNDICLLKLEYSVPLGSDVGQIALPSQDTPIGLFNVTGWGMTELGTGGLQNDLRQTTVPFVTKECCAKMYKGEIDLTENQICAGSIGHDACLGDSGGPLTHNGMQIGIASYGRGCGTNPGIYTKVANFREWIDTTIKNNE